jgi:hypothetical protein
MDAAKTCEKLISAFSIQNQFTVITMDGHNISYGNLCLINVISSYTKFFKTASVMLIRDWVCLKVTCPVSMRSFCFVKVVIAEYICNIVIISTLNSNYALQNSTEELGILYISPLVI